MVTKRTLITVRVDSVLDAITLYHILDIKSVLMVERLDILNTFINQRVSAATWHQVLVNFRIYLIIGDADAFARNKRTILLPTLTYNLHRPRSSIQNTRTIEVVIPDVIYSALTEVDVIVGNNVVRHVDGISAIRASFPKILPFPASDTIQTVLTIVLVLQVDNHSAFQVDCSKPIVAIPSSNIAFDCRRHGFGDTGA